MVLGSGRLILGLGSRRLQYGQNLGNMGKSLPIQRGYAIYVFLRLSFLGKKMPSKTERTLIALGNSRVVVMPKAWVEGMNLSPGDKLELVYDEDVIVRPAKKEAKRNE